MEVYEQIEWRKVIKTRAEKRRTRFSSSCITLAYDFVFISLTDYFDAVKNFLLVGYVCLLDHYCCQVFSSQQWTQIFSSQPEWDCVKAPNHRCFRCLPPVRVFSKLCEHKSNKTLPWRHEITTKEDETTQVQSKTIAIIAQIGDFFVICWFERKKNGLLVAAVHTHIIQLVQ